MARFRLICKAIARVGVRSRLGVVWRARVLRCGVPACGFGGDGWRPRRARFLRASARILIGPFYSGFVFVFSPAAVATLYEGVGVGAALLCARGRKWLLRVNTGFVSHCMVTVLVVAASKLQAASAGSRLF